jgi:4-methylaminobutanoate oxidase (formaldehyde-forming)
MGPRARDLLQTLVRDDISNSAFAFATLQELSISGATLRALRVSYVGELGWELHVPVEFAATIYDLIMQAGKDHGIANAGYRAIESLRLEKGYRAWGADIGPDYTPLEAGLGWAVNLNNERSFIGREAFVAQKQKPLGKSLACFTLGDKNVVLLGRETIFRDGERVGWLSSAGWGYTLKTNIGYGYVRRAEGVDMDFLLAGSYELEVATERIACEIHLQPLYDPKMERIKC